MRAGMCIAGVCSCLMLHGCEEKPPSEPVNAAVTDSAAATIIQRADSTSHEYTWKTWLFGDMPTSSLSAISAIDERNAYAVGPITLWDHDRGAGEFKTEYAMHWDGSTWQYFTVLMQMRGLLYVEPDSVVKRAGWMSSVWGEPPNNWTFSNGAPIYYDGTSFVTEYFFYRHPDPAQDSAGATYFWGNEDNRWYFGSYGKITHASGRNYVLQPTVTDAYIESVAGNRHEAWAVGLRKLPGTVLHYSDGIWRNWIDHPASLLYSTRAVWCDNIGMRPGGTVVMVGQNIVQYDTTWENMTRPLANFMPRQRFFRCVHGTARNNIWAAGDYGGVAHFNGNTWVRYPELAGGPELHFHSVWALEKHVFLVGQIGWKAIIVMGTRVD